MICGERLQVAEAAYKKAGSGDQATFDYSIILVRAKTPALIQVGIAHLKGIYIYIYIYML